MGIYTTFFAAKPADLQKVFPGWSRPRKVKRTIVNPFTKESIKVEIFEPAPGAAPGKVELPKKCAQLTQKFLLPDALGLLATDLAPSLASKTKARSFEPILSASAEETLHEVPSLLVTGLAELEDRRVTAVAKAWSSTMGEREVPYALSAADAGTVLRELRRVAAAAIAATGGVYAWVR